MPVAWHLRGTRFGKLVAVEPTHWGKNRVRAWICICDCGNELVVETGRLMSNNARRCFECWQNGAVTKTLEYRTYASMKNRCYCPSNPGYRFYGGRGIEICDKWLLSFEAFLKDMGRKPKGAYSIDRIDVNGNYEPGNCRWATPKEQMSNTRRNRYYELNGIKMTAVDWGRKLGFKGTSSAIERRLALGWSLKKALTTPKMHSRYGVSERMGRQ